MHRAEDTGKLGADARKAPLWSSRDKAAGTDSGFRWLWVGSQALTAPVWQRPKLKPKGAKPSTSIRRAVQHKNTTGLPETYGPLQQAVPRKKIYLDRGRQVRYTKHNRYRGFPLARLP